DRVLDAAARADVAGHHGPGVDADADRKALEADLVPAVEGAVGAPLGVEALDLVEDAQGRAQPALGVVVEVERGAEDGEDRVPLELVDEALVEEDDAADALEVAVEQLDDLRGGQRLAQGRVAGDVREEHG